MISTIGAHTDGHAWTARFPQTGTSTPNPGGGAGAGAVTAAEVPGRLSAAAAGMAVVTDTVAVTARAEAARTIDRVLWCRSRMCLSAPWMGLGRLRPRRL